MVSDTVIAAVIGGLSGSVVTAIGGLYRELKKQEQENTRRRAEFYLQRKVEVVSDLHATLEECVRDYLSLLDEVPMEEYGQNNEIEQAEQLLSDFEIAMDNASIYISEEHYSEVVEMYEYLNRLQSSFVGWSYEPREVRADELLTERRQNLVEQYQKVKTMLRSEVRSPLEKLEE
jgi:hypothetical protein